MLKKTASLIFAALASLTLTLAPARDAAAWDRVCVHLPLWKTAYSGRFHVIHSFKGAPGKVPNAVFVGSGAERALHALPEFGRRTDRIWSARANGQITSGNLSASKSGCVDIRGIPNGQPFFVYIYPSLGKPALCDPRGNNPNPWYVQQDRPRKELWHHAWGGVRSAKCEWRHER